MIRISTNDDVEKIAKLWLDASVQAHSFVAREYWQQMQYSVKMHYLPYAKTFVYEDKHKIKGFISIVDEQHIGALFVAPQFQGQKIGQKLLKTAQRKYPLLSLNVFAKNAKAVEFYQKHKFKIMDEQLEPSTKEQELHMCWSMECKSGFKKRHQGDS